MAKLRNEIKQTKPFSSLEVEALLNLQRTADVLMRGVAEALKPAELSPTQYNVLRILRGAGKDGLACREIGERMVTHDPDITRLLDRMEQRGLVTRERDTTDRRVVTVRATAAGIKLIENLEPTLRLLHQHQLGHLGQKNLRQLIDLLEAARDGRA